MNGRNARMTVTCGHLGLRWPGRQASFERGGTMQQWRKSGRFSLDRVDRMELIVLGWWLADRCRFDAEVFDEGANEALASVD